MVDAAHRQCEEEAKNDSTKVDEEQANEAAKVDIEEANRDTKVNQIDESIKSNTICDKEQDPHEIVKTMEGRSKETLLLNP
jgi:hypothetical protein